jgi:hemerythrin
MRWIPWDELLTTGHSVLDADHKILIALFGQLEDSVRKRRGNAVSSGLLAEIIEHAKTHFAQEEQLMAEYRYPMADRHAAEHVQLIKRAKTFKIKFDGGTPGSHIDLIHFPEDWLTFHILGADRDLGDFLATTR